MSESKDPKAEQDGFQNPIDDDNITENPHSIEYPHHRGSQIVKPEDQGRKKGLALNAMEHQTDIQLLQIKEQMELLAKQAQHIQDRKAISEQIYLAEMRFTPLINHVYHLYQRDEGATLLSLIGKDSWGRKGCPFQFIATVRLLADHTWDILEKAED